MRLDECFRGDHQEFFHQFSKSFQGTIIRKLPLEARRQVLRAADTAGIVDGPFHRRPGGDGISGHLFRGVVFNCDFRQTFHQRTDHVFGVNSQIEIVRNFAQSKHATRDVSKVIEHCECRLPRAVPFSFL